MPAINVTDDTYGRIQAFLRLGGHLADGELTPEICGEALILFGMQAILEGLWRPHEPDTLLNTLQGLAGRHPKEVMDFVADVLETGAAIQEQEALEAERPFGFAAGR
jgi:hypothetical protein